MGIKYSLRNIAAVQNKKVFFDANILIYLFWPSGAKDWEDKYASIFGEIIRQQNELFVDFIVISEIINRAIHIEHEKYCKLNNIIKNDLPFKKYRDSRNGQDALSDIHLIVETNILDKFTVIGKAFTEAEIQSFLIVNTLDFADKGILLTCKENACVLLTNDTDYTMADIDILTCHPAILRN